MPRAAGYVPALGSATGTRLQRKAPAPVRKPAARLKPLSQSAEHVFDWDDWRVLPDEDSIGWRGNQARCPYDHREMRSEVTR